MKESITINAPVPARALFDDMAFWHYDHMTLPLPERHRYPRQKYGLVRRKLEAEGTLAGHQLVRAEPAAWSLLQLLHTPAYLSAVREGTLSRQAQREIGLPFSHGLVDRARAAVNGTVAATRHAMRYGGAGNLGGGTHHAYPDRGSGYCLFNDIAVAIRYVRRHGWDGRIAIVDLDVHQGNANAAIFAGDPTVFTCSVHGERNWPYRKESSDLDLGLPDGAGDETYLAAVEQALQKVFSGFGPELVFYQAGADPLRNDRLGRLAVSVDGLCRRERLVFSALREHGTPFVVTMGGGYGLPIEETVEAHANTFRELRRAFAPADVSGDARDEAEGTAEGSTHPSSQTPPRPAVRGADGLPAAAPTVVHQP